MFYLKDQFKQCIILSVFKSNKLRFRSNIDCFIPNTNPILDHFEAGLHLSLIHKINKPTHDQERFIPYKIKVLDYEKYRHECFIKSKIFTKFFINVHIYET